MMEESWATSYKVILERFPRSHTNGAANRVTERHIAYLWVPDFAATVARNADEGLGKAPLILTDERERVLAADAQAARHGVTLAMAVRQAAARCPQAIMHPATRYPLWEAQDLLLERVKRAGDRWQPAGLGCAYLDVSEIDKDLLRWCQALADEVRGLGVAPALGLTSGKFGAVVAGQVAGWNTALLIADRAQPAFLASQPITHLPLDADALTQLSHLGIRTLGQFARLPATSVLTRFGQTGRTAQHWAQGGDDRPVLPPWDARGVSARVEFDGPLVDRDRLLAALTRQTELLLAPVRAQLEAVGRLTLMVTRADGRVIPTTHTFPLPTAAAEPIRLGLIAALDRVVWAGQGAVEVSLTLADLTDPPAQQLALFDFQREERERLAALLDRLAVRFGADAFRLAALADPDNPLPERRVAWQRFA